MFSGIFTGADGSVAAEPIGFAAALSNSDKTAVSCKAVYIVSQVEFSGGDERLCDMVDYDENAKCDAMRCCVDAAPRTL